MTKKCTRKPLILSEEQKKKIKSIAKSRLETKESTVARILLLYSEDVRISLVAKMCGVSEPTAYKYIDAALSYPSLNPLSSDILSPKDLICPDEYQRLGNLLLYVMTYSHEFTPSKKRMRLKAYKERLLKEKMESNNEPLIVEKGELIYPRTDIISRILNSLKKFFTS